MNATGHHSLRSMLVAAAAALVAACAAESPVGVERQSAPAAQLAREVDLGTCQRLAAPVGSKLDFHAYATGVQIYRWSGTAWDFVAPSAVLYADAGGHGVVGIHYAGPTWESNSGSKVVAAVSDRCTPDASAIPWLVLDAVSTTGPGIFERTATVQRLYTVGGKAPATAGSFIGEEARVPYTAEYFFYRAP